MKKHNQIVKAFSNDLMPGIAAIIERARQKTAVFLNSETTLMYWAIGSYINQNLKENNRTEYGSQIVATLSQQLTELPNKHLFADKMQRAMELAKMNDKLNNEMMQVPLAQITWYHYISLLSTIKDIAVRELKVSHDRIFDYRPQRALPYRRFAKRPWQKMVCFF